MTNPPENNTAARIVTIDGPAASGKSSVSRELARRLGWHWVSTGIFYRGIAWVADSEKVASTDTVGLVALIRSKRWAVELTANETQFLWQGQNVTPLLGSEQVGAMASKISAVPEVRAELLAAQRQCAVDHPIGLIAEGRDCGTVVFPKAQLKFYLTARAEDRAARRLKQDGAEEGPATMEILLDRQKERDAQDRSRKVAPLAAADGAFTIDSSALNLGEVVQLILEKVAISLGVSAK